MVHNTLHLKHYLAPGMHTFFSIRLSIICLSNHPFRLLVPMINLSLKEFDFRGFYSLEILCSEKKRSLFKK